jgi:predicted HTH transcriptional regulator
MKEHSITTDEALRLCSRTEDHFFDRKAPGLDGVKLQKLVVAFANADGGELIIGIADEKEEAKPVKRWRGLARIEDFNGLLQAVHTLKSASKHEKRNLINLREVEARKEGRNVFSARPEFGGITLFTLIPGGRVH